MSSLAAFLVAAPAALALYAYGLYPIMLRVAGGSRGRPPSNPDAGEWPTISIVMVAHDAEETIRAAIERLLAVDYPGERRQILVVSDASTDGTDRIVGEFAAQGVELHRVEPRGGKTAAENAVANRVRGEIVVNVDASVLVTPGSIKALVRAFADPNIGVVSGRAVSIPSAALDGRATGGDATYYTYEMWVRSLEMEFGTVIGATGALYAVRRGLFDVPLAPHATRDFASPLVARERGFRSVIDDEAVCFVRETPSLRREYDRKVRTMVRGLDTLYEFRHLLHPVRHGRFALMLASHKLCRWLVYLLAPLTAIGVVGLALDWWPARVAALLVLTVVSAGLAAIHWPAERRVPAPLALCGYAVIGGAAGAAAWRRFLRGEHMAVWEPTRRGGYVDPSTDSRERDGAVAQRRGPRLRTEPRSIPCTRARQDSPSISPPMLKRLTSKIPSFGKFSPP
jgi:glycosyltransferase involved in cell wall biosynthesis